MHIDHYLALAAQHKQQAHQSYTISKLWSQGRTVYGGISAGILYGAAKSYLLDERLLRSMTINFVGPLYTEKPFQIEVEEIRIGKNVSQYQARAIQDGKNCLIAQCCFAASRQSKISIANTEKHNLVLPTKAKFIPQIPKITPKFLRHFDLSIVTGGIPFTGKDSHSYEGWMRYKNAPTAMTDAHLVSIIDAWPPTVLQMLKWPAPASTISWNLEFLHPHQEVLPTDWFAYKAHTRQAGDGYGHTEATIWDAHGQVIAISRQTIAVFD